MTVHGLHTSQQIHTCLKLLCSRSLVTRVLKRVSPSRACQSTMVACAPKPGYLGPPSSSVLHLKTQTIILITKCAPHLGFYQHKNHKSGHISHTGPLTRNGPVSPDGTNICPNFISRETGVTSSLISSSQLFTLLSPFTLFWEKKDVHCSELHAAHKPHPKVRKSTKIPAEPTHTGACFSICSLRLHAGRDSPSHWRLR